MIIAITGASGVGKTSTLKELSRRLPEDGPIKIFHFDDIGMPNWDEVPDHKKWQEETTIEWIDRLVKIAKEEKVHILFEGSTESKFFRKGFEKNRFTDYKLILFDCDKETMKQRLMERGQPELFQPDMVNWLYWLRDEANELEVEIIKTDDLTKSEIGELVLSKLNA